MHPSLFLSVIPDTGGYLLFYVAGDYLLSLLLGNESFFTFFRRGIQTRNTLTRLLPKLSFPRVTIVGDMQHCHYVRAKADEIESKCSHT
jgi:hypothetical protein